MADFSIRWKQAVPRKDRHRLARVIRVSGTLCDRDKFVFGDGLRAGKVKRADSQRRIRNSKKMSGVRQSVFDSGWQFSLCEQLWQRIANQRRCIAGIRRCAIKGRQSPLYCCRKFFVREPDEVIENDG